MDSKKREVERFLGATKNTNEEDIIFPENFTHAMQDYYTFLAKGTCGDIESDYAFVICKDKFKKEIVEALILAGASPEEVQSVFGIPVKSIKIYQELFYDTTKFISYLDKLSYVENYPSKFGRELKIRALSLGPDFIYFTYGRLTPTTNDQKKLLKRLFLTSAYKAMELNFNSVNTIASKNSVELGKLMLKSYDALTKILSDENSGTGEFVEIITSSTPMTHSSQILLSVKKEDIV